MKKILVVIACLAVFWMALPAEAALQIPSYAQGGDLKTVTESKGKKITEIVSLVVVIISIICIMIGGGYFSVGNGERGKQFVVGSVVGLILAGAAYSIAQTMA